MRPQPASWASMWNASVQTGCLTALLPALLFIAILPFQAAPLWVAVVLALGQFASHAVLSIPIALLTYGSNALLAMLLMYGPLHERWVHAHGPWVSLIILTVWNTAVSVILARLMSLLMAVLLVSAQVTPLIGLVTGAVTWYGAVEWFAPLELHMSSDQQWHRWGGLVCILGIALLFWWILGIDSWVDLLG